MNTKDDIKRLIRIILALYVVGIVIGIAVVAYGTYQFSSFREVITRNQNSFQAIVNARLDKVDEQVASIKHIPLKGDKGDKGERGDDGQDSVSTNTVIENRTTKEVPVNGKDGESAYEIAVRHGYIGSEEDWLLSLKGEPARQVEPCLLRTSLILGWRYIGTTGCLNLEVGQ